MIFLTNEHFYTIKLQASFTFCYLHIFTLYYEKTCLYFFLGCAFPCLAVSQNKTQKVAVFKNGWGFFINQTEVKTQNKVYDITEIPKAAMGTLWYVSPELNQISKTYKNTSKKSDIENLTDIIVANTGRNVRFVLNNDSTLTGVIEKASATMVVLKTPQKWITLHSNQIKQVDFFSVPNTEKERKDSTEVIRLSFNSDKTHNLMYSYFEKGVTWIPNYYLELKPSNKATLLLRAEVMNDVSDLTNAELNFVVGVPNFRIPEKLSPIVSKETVFNFMSFLYGGGRSRNEGLSREYSNVMQVQTVNYNRTDMLNDGDNIIFTEMDKVGDLFFYTQKNVTLKKGDRAMYNLLQAEITVKHLYEANIDANSEYSYSYYRTASDAQKSPVQVWHSVMLENTSTVPFTTGNALIVQQETNNSIYPIAQDKLNYTPPGAKSTLKLSVANDILVKNTDKETEKSEKHKKINNIEYDLVTVQSEIELENFKNEDITVAVKRTVIGEVKNTSVPWQTYKSVSYTNSHNATNNITWDISLKPKEKKKIAYSYQILARR